jgi:hypothetical protein
MYVQKRLKMVNPRDLLPEQEESRHLLGPTDEEIEAMRPTDIEVLRILTDSAAQAARGHPDIRYHPRLHDKRAQNRLSDRVHSIHSLFDRGRGGFQRPPVHGDDDAAACNGVVAFQSLTLYSRGWMESGCGLGGAKLLLRRRDEPDVVLRIARDMIEITLLLSLPILGVVALTKKYPPATINPNHIRNLLKDYEVRDKFKPDIIYLDYLELVRPAHVRKSDNTYTECKRVAEEIRALAVDYAIPIVSALQTNRTGYGKSDIDLSNTADSMGLAFTGDIVFGVTQLGNSIRVKVMDIRM